MRIDTLTSARHGTASACGGSLQPVPEVGCRAEKPSSMRTVTFTNAQYHATATQSTAFLFLGYDHVSIMYLVLNIQRSSERTCTGEIVDLQALWPVASDLSWTFFLCVYFSGVRDHPWFRLYMDTTPSIYSSFRVV